MRGLLFYLSLMYQTSVAQVNVGSHAVIDTSVNLYVFVGQPISLQPFDANYEVNKNLPYEVDSLTGDTTRKRIMIMDAAYIASYKVLRPVFNHLKSDTISFRAFDHWGIPAFWKYSSVLLYISESEDGSYYFHQKYLFDPVRKLKNGSWVGKRRRSVTRLFNEQKDNTLKVRGVFKS